jgi:hypothetical protein
MVHLLRLSLPPGLEDHPTSQWLGRLACNCGIAGAPRRQLLG